MLLDQPVKEFPTPSFVKNRIIIVGGYGSGKSEVAVNLARHLAGSQKQPVAIADLDIVNPYFRSREADEQLEKLAIKTLNPQGGYRHADLPIILPEIKGAVEGHDGLLILDVGGDDVGARILSTLSGSFVDGSYELLLVLNANRPFTQDVAGCIKLMAEIEAAGRLKFTGTIANTHLLTDTTADTVMMGLSLAEKLRKETTLPTVFVSCTRDVLETISPANLSVPVLVLDRLLLKPWERSEG